MSTISYGTPRPSVGDWRSLVALLEHRAATAGDQIIFSFVRGDCRDASITFRALHERATAIAGELQSKVARGERALLLFPPGLEFIEAFFGCLYAGVIAVPAALPARSRSNSPVAAILKACDPALILSSAEHCNHARRLYEHLPML